MSLAFILPKADLIYGASGTYKTSNVGLAAMYVWKRYGKRTRLVSTDGGGFDPLLPLIHTGIIMPPWVVTDWPYIVEMLDKATKGWWPTDVTKKQSLLRPFDEKVAAEIGLVAFEGLTSMGDSILRHLREQKARLSQDPSFQWADGGTTYAGGNMSYFGFTQDRLHDMVMNSHLIPAEKVLWTALEAKGQEEGTRSEIYGPAIAGKKSIGKATQWFGNSLHFEALVTVGQQNKETGQIDVTTEPVMYLRPHADPLYKIVFPAKTRAPYQFAAELPLYLKPPNIATLWERIEVMEDKAEEAVKADLSKPKQPSSATSSVVYSNTAVPADSAIAPAGTAVSK